jgi:O-antigen/teichoic acid export membrane protein
MSSRFLKGVLKGSFWVVFATVITRFAGFIALPILARILGPADLGLYNLVQNTVQTGDGLSRIGTDAAMHRNGAQYETLGTQAVGRLFGVGACLTIFAGSFIAICLWVGRKVIAQNWFVEPKIEPWLILTALAIFFTVIGNPSWFYLVALQAFRTYSLRASVISILGAVVTLLLAYYFGLTGAVYSLLLTAFVQATWGWWLTLPILKEKGIKLRSDNFFDESLSILAFGLPFYGSNFLSSFIALPLLGYVSKAGGIEQVGYLRIAQSLSQFVSFLPTAIAPVIISSLSASLAADIKGYRQIKSLHLRSLWVVILITTVAICFSLEGLITTLFGSAYTKAILLSRLTIWMTAISSISGILGQHIISFGKTRTIALVQVIALVIHIAFALALIPLYSSTGLLLAQSLAAIFTLVAYVRPALTDIESEDKKHLWLLTGLSVIMLVLTFTLPIVIKNRWILLVISFLVTKITVVLSLRVAFNLQEIKIAFQTIKNKINLIKK